MSEYFALLTTIGQAKLANATALDQPVAITQMALGDGNGETPTPNESQTALLNEQYRASLNSLSVDDDNPSQIIAELVVPENKGGFWIRELGLFDDNGDMVAIANCPPTYKPMLSEGSGRVQRIRMVLTVSNTSAVTLKIDPAVVLATRDYVDGQALIVHQYVDSQHDSLKAYVDSQDDDLKDYIDAQDKAGRTAAKSDATKKANAAQSAAATDASTKANQALADAKSYADTQDATELAAAKSYADTQDAATLNSAESDASSKANQALADAKTNTTEQLQAHTAEADPHTQYLQKSDGLTYSKVSLPTGNYFARLCRLTNRDSSGSSSALFILTGGGDYASTRRDDLLIRVTCRGSDFYGMCIALHARSNNNGFRLWYVVNDSTIDVWVSQVGYKTPYSFIPLETSFITIDTQTILASSDESLPELTEIPIYTSWDAYNLPMITEAQAEDSSSTTPYAWTPQRVAQVAALYHSFGADQTRHIYTVGSDRVFGTTYTVTGDKPRLVQLCFGNSSGSANLTVIINGEYWLHNFPVARSDDWDFYSATYVFMPGETYSFSFSGNSANGGRHWMEIE